MTYSLNDNLKDELNNFLKAVLEKNDIPLSLYSQRLILKNIIEYEKENELLLNKDNIKRDYKSSNDFLIIIYNLLQCFFHL